MAPPALMPEDIDTIVVGAGISGFNSAYRIREAFPTRSLAILEAREITGGTWSFFQYPGLRCDSSMACYTFRWHPWKSTRTIVSGREIAEYIHEAAEQSGLLEIVRFRHRVIAANWNSQTDRWEVTVDVPPNADDGATVANTKHFSAKFVVWAAGYYSYSRALATPIHGLDSFTGTVAHPQFWPTDLSTANKRIAIIGSGATAITMFPTLAQTAAQVTLVQRSPSYIMSISSSNATAARLKRWLPLRMAHYLAWYTAVGLEAAYYLSSMYMPDRVRQFILENVREACGDAYPGDEHFTPRYQPLGQRTCFTPDDEFFKAVKQKNTSIVTGTIESITPFGIRMEDGTEIKADIIVTATGMYLELFNGVAPSVDGTPISLSEHFTWRGCMLEKVPNMAFMMGFVAQTWTVSIDTAAGFVVSVMKYMDRVGATRAIPTITMDKKTLKHVRPLIDSEANYIKAGRSRVPNSSATVPWYGNNPYLYEWWQSAVGNVTDGMEYYIPPKKTL